MVWINQFTCGRGLTHFHCKHCGKEEKVRRLSTILILVITVCLLFSGGSYAKSFTIGLSNGWVGSEWRTQMIDEAKAAAAKWQDEGVEVKVIVQSSNVDVQGQIAHVRNFINQGVDAIIINPNSPTAFDPVFRQAKKQGIIVISTDAEVSSKDAIYVGIDQKGWAMKSAKWLAETLNGKGKVVAINGVAGHPANQMRVEGYREVFEKYEGIEILNEVNCQPQNALMVGDDWGRDIEPAAGMGMLTYWIQLPGTSPPDEMLPVAYGSLERLLARIRSDWLQKPAAMV